MDGFALKPGESFYAFKINLDGFKHQIFSDKEKAREWIGLPCVHSDETGATNFSSFERNPTVGAIRPMPDIMRLRYTLKYSGWTKEIATLKIDFSTSKTPLYLQMPDLFWDSVTQKRYRLFEQIERFLKCEPSYLP